MDVLIRAFDPTRPIHRPLIPFPLWVFLPFAAVCLVALVTGQASGPPGMTVRILGLPAFHVGLLAASLAAAWEGTSGWGRHASGVALVLLVASSACAWTPWGCLAYLLPPLAVAVCAVGHAECRRMGLAPPADWRALGGGVAVGCFLGGHLLLSASRTFGYPVRLELPASYLTGVLYDLGANVLSAECFFRGTLFNRWHRLRGFWPGALAATGLCLLRYLGDPALPPTVEVMASAIFYLALLSLSGCALLWYSGSLLPSLAASLLFFSAYRMLHVW